MSERESTLEAIRESLDLLLRLKLEDIRATRNQTEMIKLLDSVGCPPSKIAALLGTTTNTVNPVLSRARGKAKKKR